MLRSRLSTLRPRLVLLVLLAMVPALCLVLYTGQLGRQAAEAAARQDARRLARLVTGDVQRLIDSADQVLFVLAASAEVRSGQPADCDRLLAGLIQHQPVYANLGVADLSGMVTCSAVPVSGATNLADRIYFRRAVQSGEFAIGEYQVGRITGRASLNFGQPVRDESGRLQGVAFAALDLARLDQVAAGADLPPGVVLVVVDEHGTVLARYPDPLNRAGQPAPDGPVVQAVLGQLGPGDADALVDGAWRLYAYGPVGRSDGKLYVGVGIPYSVAFANADRMMAIHFAGLVVVALLALGLAWWGGEVFVLRRVRNLVRATQRLASGDLSARAGLDHAGGELGDLSRAFDQMAQRLEQHAQERGLAEEALRESEARYRAILEQSVEAVYLYEAETQRLLEGNPAFRRLLGYDEDELRSLTLYDVVAHDRDSIDRYLAQLRAAGSTVIGERLWRRKEGTLLEMEVTASRIWHQGRMLIVVIGRDITERRQREREDAALVSLASALRAARTRAEMLPVLLDQVLALVSAGGAAIDADDLSSGEIVIEMGRGTWAAATGVRVPASQAPGAEHVAAGQPYLADEASTEAGGFPREPWGLVRAMARLPLVTENGPGASLWVGREAPFTEAELRLLSALANMAASALNRAALHEQTERRLRHLAALRAIDLAISTSRALPATLDILLEQTTRELAVDAAVVLLLDASTQTLQSIAGRGFRSPDILRVPPQAGPEHPRLHIPGLPQMAFPFLDWRQLAEEGFVAGHAALIVASEQLRGFLCVFHRGPLTPDREWLDFLDALAGQAAIAIDHAELVEGLLGSHQELVEAYEATIEGWSRALDLRDRETEGHTQRVTRLTVRLASAMGLDEQELVHIRRGALLHDIGKLGIPDRILLKPGPLTDEEWILMRQHPEYAYQMLAPIAYLRPALDIPRYHHEKWDGTGYPLGLKGEQIPLAARLFAVVDVWDALRSDRPYRPAWPEASVQEHLRDQAGKHFDPQVVEAFLRLEPWG